MANSPANQGSQESCKLPIEQRLKRDWTGSLDRTWTENLDRPDRTWIEPKGRFLAWELLQSDIYISLYVLCWLLSNLHFSFKTVIYVRIVLKRSLLWLERCLSNDSGEFVAVYVETYRFAPHSLHTMTVSFLTMNLECFSTRKSSRANSNMTEKTFEKVPLKVRDTSVRNWFLRQNKHLFLPQNQCKSCNLTQHYTRRWLLFHLRIDENGLQTALQNSPKIMEGESLFSKKKIEESADKEITFFVIITLTTLKNDNKWSKKKLRAEIYILHMITLGWRDSFSMTRLPVSVSFMLYFLSVRDFSSYSSLSNTHWKSVAKTDKMRRDKMSKRLE